MANQELITEWQTLQTQSDRFEQQSLFIKLAAIALTATLLTLKADSLPLIAITLIFWLQDAIWKTYQSRTESRLLQVEQAISAPDSAHPFIAMQFNRDFAASRPGAIALLGEYFSQSCRPTVAFPHALLTLLALFASLG